MDLIEFMQSVGCPLQPYQEAMIRELMKRTTIKIITTPRGRVVNGVCLTDNARATTVWGFDEVWARAQLPGGIYKIQYTYQPPAHVSPREAGLKSKNAGPHWVLDKYNIPSPPPRLDIPSKTRALLSRIGV